MRPSTSLLIAAIALAATALAVRSYLRLKEKYPNSGQSIRQTPKDMKGCDCAIEREGLPGPTDKDEEYRILSMLLGERTRPSARRGTLIVISKEVDSGDGGYVSDPKCRETEAWSDLARKDKDCFSLEERFQVGGPLVLISRGELKEIFRDNDGWDRFRKKYPGADGIHDFSRVGFSHRGDIAVVRVGCRSGWDCGIGGTLVLVRTREGWESRGWRRKWIS